MQLDPKHVTVYTDASLNLNSDKFKEYGIQPGGWGAYIRWEKGSIVCSGPLAARTSNEAEGLAQYAGIVCASNFLPINPTGFWVRSDNKAALSLWRFRFKRTQLPNNYHGKDGWAKEVLKLYKHALKGRKIDYKHVKGHQGGTTIPSWCNELCDEWAGREARMLSYGHSQGVLVLTREGNFKPSLRWKRGPVNGIVFNP